MDPRASGGVPITRHRLTSELEGCSECTTSRSAQGNTKTSSTRTRPIPPTSVLVGVDVVASQLHSRCPGTTIPTKKRSTQHESPRCERPLASLPDPLDIHAFKASIYY